jgi:hypothetical protein
MVLASSWLLAACELTPLTPDWEALYAEKLGQPIVELNEAALNTPFQDRHGNLTRLTWAQLRDGSTALLGLPAHGNPVEQVVERTVVLTQDEWQRLCQEALGTEVYGWGWSAATDAVTNTFDVYASTQPLDEARSVRIIPDPEAPYCQFAFLPQGWELRIVQSQGIVAPAR